MPALPPKNRVAPEAMPVIGKHQFAAANAEDGLHRLVINNLVPYQMGMVIQLIGATAANWALFLTAVEEPLHTGLNQANKRLIGGNASAATELDADDDDLWLALPDGASNNTIWHFHTGSGTSLGANYLLVGNPAENPLVAVFAK